MRNAQGIVAAIMMLMATVGCSSQAEQAPPVAAPAPPTVPDYAGYTAALQTWVGTELHQVTDTYDKKTRADSICRQLAGDTSPAAQARLALKLRLELSNWLDLRGNRDERIPDDIESAYAADQIAAAVQFVCP